jgi:Transposase DDE domain group 1
VKSNARSSRVAVSSDGKGLVSQAGAVLLWETMRVTGLGRGLSQGLSRWRAPRAARDPGKIAADLAAAVALGGDCLADIAVLREQPGLAGQVASDPVVSRLFSQLAADLPRALKAIRGARAAALDRRDHHRGHPPAGHVIRLTSQNRPDDEEEKPPGPVEPRTPGATAGQPGTAGTRKSNPAEHLSTADHGRERSRLT